MEYVDSEVEFVPENLDISTLRLLPGHIYMSSITDVDITARGGLPKPLGTLTHIRLQALQLTLRSIVLL